ncbi:MAG: Hsp70 family protein [Ilumatobacteraceae bacterium]
MSYSLGIDLGTTFTSAAVYEAGRTSIVDLSDRSSTIPSVVFLADDGTFFFGDSAARRTLMDPDRSAAQFKRRFGDTAPLLLGGTPISADQLSAQLLRSVVDQVALREGGTPDHVAITHPAGWGGYKLELLDQTMRGAGLDGAITLTEPEAAVLHYAGLDRIPTDATVAVFDLGGGTFDAAVIHKTESGTEFLGRPDGIERLGGIDFDAAIFAFVSANLDGAIDELDLTEPTNRSALERLHHECIDAKEALSVDDVADIPVLLPGVQSTVRITRTDFETAIRPALAQAIAALQRAIASAGIEPADLDAVLLAGGSSRIPLVAEMLTAELDRPVAVDAHPKHVVALGAALAAGTSATVSEGPLRTTPPKGIVPLEAVTGAAALAAAAANDPTAPALPIIIPQTPTGPIDLAAPGPDAAATTQMDATQIDATQPITSPTNPAGSTDATTQMAAAVGPGDATTVVPTVAAAPFTDPSGPMAAPPTGDDMDSRKGLVITAIVAAVLLLGGLAAFALSNRGDDGADAGDDGSGATTEAPIQTDPAVAPVASDAPPATDPSPTEPPSTTEPASDTTAVATTDAATTTQPPLPFPLDTRRSDLSGITLVGAMYEITYDTINFEPLIAGGEHHLHFFWNTESPESVGTASNPIGDWFVWDLDAAGEKVFDQFSPALAPAGATQICAVVANDAHAVDAPEYVNDTVSCIDMI